MSVTLSTTWSMPWNSIGEVLIRVLREDRLLAAGDGVLGRRTLPAVPDVIT
jgi:hypothetical protein